MNKQEYAEFENAVRGFFDIEGINNLTSISGPYCTDCETDQICGDCQRCHACGGEVESETEPYFSSQPCDCCQSNLAGDRHPASGYNPTQNEAQYYSICGDCVYYAEYGKLDDMSMLEIESCAS